MSMNIIISTNGIALFDYNGITPDQKQKIREYATVVIFPTATPVLNCIPQK